MVKVKNERRGLSGELELEQSRSAQNGQVYPA